MFYASCIGVSAFTRKHGELLKILYVPLNHPKHIRVPTITRSLLLRVRIGLKSGILFTLSGTKWKERRHRDESLAESKQGYDKWSDR